MANATFTAVQLSLRARLYDELEPHARGRHGLSFLNRIVCAFILVSVGATVMETERPLVARHEGLFLAAEILFTAFFAVEYFLRLWASAENPAFGPGLKGRLKYIFSPLALLDLLAFAPALLLPGASETFLLRIIRLIRILRLARLGRFSTAVQYLAEAVRSRTYELGITVGIALCLLVASSTLLYLVESGVQPEEFGSIPRAMWWAAITLTTVGYGDVYPITALGKFIAGITALAGIGLIAMPTGILAAAFSDAVQRRKADKSKGGVGSGE
jgi:voltage-gated potassium channel